MTQQFPPENYQPSYPQQYPQQVHNNGNNGLIIGLVIGLVILLLALIAGGAFFLGSNRTGGIASTSGDAPMTVVETQTMTRQAPQPEQVQENAPTPVASGGCNYSNYSAATSKTSSAFAANVYSAFMDACARTGSSGVNLSVYSPVTGMTYSMSCSGVSTVSCRGGDNAVVKIW